MTGYPVALSQAEFITRVQRDVEWRDFVVDSRAVQDGSVFFALPGERSDGHLYISQAIEAGARAVVLYKSYFDSHEQTLLEAAGIGEHVDESPVVPEIMNDREPVVFVPVQDSLTCLQEAGKAVLDLSRAKSIAVTGSNGKTGTRDMLAAVLAQAGSVHFRKGNFNSVIGLPVVMAATPADVDYAALEMAMSEKGEMARLAELVKPDAALITNIGTAHIGNIGSVEAIAEEKFQIFSLMGEDGIAVIPADDENAVRQLHKNTPDCRIVMYGCTSEYGFELLESSASGSRFIYMGQEYALSLSGKHHIHNACGVISLALALGLDPQLIRKGLESFEVPTGRGSIVPGPVTIIDDSYNANPDSVLAAFAAAVQIHKSEGDGGAGGRLFFALGDMKELGTLAGSSHQRVLNAAMVSGADRVVLYGSDFVSAAGSYVRGSESQSSDAGVSTQNVAGLYYSENFDEICEYLGKELSAGDTLLIKASRSMELERIITFVKNLFPSKGNTGEENSV